jgi:hypothetical protein
MQHVKRKEGESNVCNTACRSLPSSVLCFLQEKHAMKELWGDSVRPATRFTVHIFCVRNYWKDVDDIL